MAVILITHDLGVVAEVADHVNVMYAGRIVEAGTLDEIFYDPQHPYTWGLLGSLTRPDRPRTDAAGPDRRASRRRCSRPPRAATSARAARMRSTSARRRRRSSREAARPGHLDRCWLPPEQKQTLRVDPGRPDRPRGAAA